MIEGTLKDMACTHDPLRIVVVEGDVELRETVLVPGLVREGFVARGASGALELYRRLATERFDVAVLDIGLPEDDGLLAARHLRSTTSMAIVILSGQDCDARRLRDLDEAGDVYLPRPVDIQVLAANLRNLSTRIRQQAQTQAETSGGWRQEGGGWRLRAPNGAGVALTLAEKQLAELLFAHAGEPVHREYLIGQLAEDAQDFDPHRLEMMVYRLRLKCERETGARLPLRAVRGVGYMLVP